jgi:hypothetical protein
MKKMSSLRMVRAIPLNVINTSIFLVFGASSYIIYQSYEVCHEKNEFA